MPPKKTYSQTQILQCAMEIVRETGITSLSVRTIATRMGCSTMPIYSCYNSMDVLLVALREEITRLFLSYMTKEETDDPLVNMTWGYIQFAQDEPRYFQMMFADTTPRALADYFQKRKEVEMLHKETIRRHPVYGKLTDEQRSQLMIITYLYGHGIADLCRSSRSETPSLEDVIRVVAIVYQGVRN